MPKAVGLDHIVLCVADVERALAWYVDELGLEPLRVDEWRDGTVLFPSARIDAGTIIDFFPESPSGKNMEHVCLVIEATDLDALAASDRFDVASGPSEVFGARGMGRSVYVRDPDANLVELRCY
jgi:catechol 2,3-dioxygenase-like lactoylglutathione lyase family enzyme